eukprot:14941117-Alexandrium_andersonii.AAC.1
MPACRARWKMRCVNAWRPSIHLSVTITNLKRAMKRNKMPPISWTSSAPWAKASSWNRPSDPGRSKVLAKKGLTSGVAQQRKRDSRHDCTLE